MKKSLAALAAIGMFAIAFSFQISEAQAKVQSEISSSSGCDGATRVCCANSTVTHRWL